MKYIKLSLVVAASVSLAISAGCSREVMTVDYGAKVATEVKNVVPVEGKAALDGSAVCCNSLIDLKYLPIEKPGRSDYTIGLDNDVFLFSTGKSFVQGLKLPDADEKIRVAISTPITTSVYVPSVLILDASFEPIRLYGPDTIKYDKATILTGERYFGEFTISHEDRARFLVVFSTQEAMSGETVLAPLSSEAIESGSAFVAKRRHMNEPIPHSAIGVVRLAFDYLPSTSGKSKELIASQVVNSGQTQQATEDLVPESKVSVEEQKGAIQPLSEAEMIVLIQKSVQQGDLNKAMKMVEQAEKSGSTKAREAFIEALR